MTELSTVATAFVETAHRIVWCTVATVDTAGLPRTRILHPVWEWDGHRLTGWIATSPDSPKARHLTRTPVVALSYWDATHDVASAVCDAQWRLDADSRAAGWTRFAEAPPPVGYDPTVIPGWESPESPTFGILELGPRSLHVMAGSDLLKGEGRGVTWSR